MTPPLHILGMIASPRDQDALDTGRERKRLEDAIAPLQQDGRVALTWIQGETWRDLQRAMRTGEWNIFHFIGHGAYDETKDEGFIALSDEGGRTHLLSAAQLGRLLDDHGPLRLAVLNSCEGARGGTKEVLSSTAAVLMRRGVPAVVAMQYEITDRAAIEFTRAFYEAIADGQPVDGAVSEARIAVSLALERTLEWGVPVLYMHAPDGRIFSVDAPVSTNGARAHPRTPRRIAVLDDAKRWAKQHVRLVTAVGAALAAALVAVVVTVVLTGGGSSGGAATAGGPTVRWKFKTHDGNLYALNESSGKERWRFKTGGEVESSPAVGRNLVYVGSDDGRVYALDSATGFERWRFETGQPVFSSPAVAGRAVYVGSRDDNIYALDARSGRKLWRFTTGDEVWSSPTVANGVVYVGSNDHNIYALDAATGQEQWRFTTRAGVSSSPAVANGTVYVGSFDHGVYAVDARTGKRKWRFQTLDTVFSSPTVDNGVVYVGSHDHNVYALDERTGRMRWRFETGKLVGSSPAVFGGVVYVGSDDGFLYAVEIPTQ